MKEEEDSGGELTYGVDEVDDDHETPMPGKDKSYNLDFEE
jgi:hypothetical protein